MPEVFVGIAAMLEALPRIRACLSEADAELDFPKKRQAIVRAGAIGCGAFSELVADHELWTALKHFYSDSTVQENVARNLPNGRFPRLAVQQVTNLLLRLQYEPPNHASEMVQAAGRLTEDLNRSFNSGAEMPRLGLHVVLTELMEDSFEQIREAICSLKDLAKMDQLADKDVEHARAILARAWNYGNALLAVAAIATPFPSVQTEASRLALAAATLAGGAADMLGSAMLSLGPGILLQEATSARVISWYMRLSHGPGGGSRQAAYDARAAFNQSASEAHERMRLRLEAYRQLAFREAFRDETGQPARPDGTLLAHGPWGTVSRGAGADEITPAPSSPADAPRPPAPSPRTNDGPSGPGETGFG